MGQTKTQYDDLNSLIQTHIVEAQKEHREKNMNRSGSPKSNLSKMRLSSNTGAFFNPAKTNGTPSTAVLTPKSTKQDRSGSKNKTTRRKKMATLHTFEDMPLLSQSDNNGIVLAYASNLTSLCRSKKSPTSVSRSKIGFRTNTFETDRTKRTSYC